MALALGGQAFPHLLQFTFQPKNHLREVLQLACVEVLGVLQSAFQAFLLVTIKQTTLWDISTEFSFILLLEAAVLLN